MKKTNIILLIIVGFLTMPCIVIAKSSDDESEKKIIYTTLDIDREYEVLSIIASPEDVRPVSGLRGRGPVERAYEAVWEKFKNAAKEIEADAVVGVRIELENINQQVVGRILIYGTAVRFLEEQDGD